jgi:ribonuclease BN (tRNA processing enzyme)
MKALMLSGPDPGSVLDWHDITDQTSLAIGPLRFTFARTDHPPETLAVRVDSVYGAFGYSADTGPGWSMEALGPDIDLAICEASYLHEREGSAPHLSARQAGESARKAGVKRLLLSHIWPIVDPAASATEASEAFGAPVECAVINATYPV